MLQQKQQQKNWILFFFFWIFLHFFDYFFVKKQNYLNRLNTLQPSQVMAPKWTPDDGALHTEQAKPLNNSATVGLLGFSKINNYEQNWVFFNKFGYYYYYYLPFIVMPTSLHFWKRQYWHWVRVVLTITQSWFRRHLYLASSPFMLRKKNF